MTSLAPLNLEKLGTASAESLESYIVRLAYVHNVTPLQLARVVRRTTQCEAKDAERSAATSLFYSGGGIGHVVGNYATTASTAKSFELLTGQTELVRGTFIPLSRLLPNRGSSTFSVNRRWCPECYGDNGLEATPLLWCTSLARNCEVHETPLVSKCAWCGAYQRYLCQADSKKVCRLCSRSLSMRGGVQDNLSEWGKLCDQTMRELIAYSSRPNSDEIDPLAFHRFVDRWRENHRGLVGVSPWAREWAEAFHAANRKEGDHRSARLESICKFAALQSVSVIDLLTKPEECANKTLFSSCKLRIPIRTKVFRDMDSLEKLLVEARSFLISDHLQLPPASELCLKYGFKKFTLYQKNPELSVAYGEKRRNQRQVQKDAAARRATLKAAELIGEMIARGSKLEATKLANLVKDSVSVSKWVAYQAVREEVSKATSLSC